MGGSHSIRRDQCSPLSTQPDVAIAAAAGAGLRRYVASLQLSNNSATAREIRSEHWLGDTRLGQAFFSGDHEPCDQFCHSRSRVQAVQALFQRSGSWAKTPHIKNGRYLAERGLYCVPTGQRFELTANAEDLDITAEG